MVQIDLILADPPWHFSDRLRQSKLKRGAESQYDVLKDKDIINLNVKDIAAKDAVLVLWVPGSKLDIGIKCCDSWGFKVKQTWIWTKTKKEPLKNLRKSVVKLLKSKKEFNKDVKAELETLFNDFDMDESLNFFMGRMFRQTHELALICTRGKCSKMIKNKSQRSVHICPAIDKHSEKPEKLQDMLDIMIPDKNLNRLELFARRQREGYICIGNEALMTCGEDIRDSLKKLAEIEEFNQETYDNWKKIVI